MSTVYFTVFLELKYANRVKLQRLWGAFLYLIYALLLNKCWAVQEMHFAVCFDYQFAALFRIIIQFSTIWCSSTKKFYLKILFCNLNILLLGVFVTTVVTTPIWTPITMENVEASNNGSECKVLKDCYFFQQFELKEIADSLRQLIKSDITQQTCGLNIYR